MANLGTILQGLRIENSPYNLTVMVRERARGRDLLRPGLAPQQRLGSLRLAGPPLAASHPEACG
jgi:hypothetical protein